MSNRKNFPKLWPHAAALISGVELAFCFPTWNVGNLVWVALTPLLAALWFSEPKKSKKGKTIPRWRHGFLLGYIAGLGFFLTNLWWLWSMAKPLGCPRISGFPMRPPQKCSKKPAPASTELAGRCPRRFRLARDRKRNRHLPLNLDRGSSGGLFARGSPCRYVRVHS